MKKQRGLALLAVLALVSVVGLGSSLMPRAYPGTYQAFVQDGALMRIDTRTGNFQRCSVTGGVLKCEDVEVAK